MKIIGRVLLIVVSIELFSLEINIDNPALQEFFILQDSLITVTSEKYNSIDLIFPLRATYSNIDNDGNLSLAAVRYTKKSVQLHTGNLKINQFLKDFSYGVFYIAWDGWNGSLYTSEPLDSPEKIIKVIVRKDDTFIGYLFELINTPFIFTPLRNANGKNQVDNHIGSDCGSFVTYGLRRIGLDIPYCAPQKLIQYLKPLKDNRLYIDEDQSGVSKYLDDSGSPFYINEDELQKGIILSFQEQMAVLYEDKGIIGILDSEDLIIESWFDGPVIVRIRNNGFWGVPISVFTY